MNACLSLNLLLFQISWTLTRTRITDTDHKARTYGWLALLVWLNLMLCSIPYWLVISKSFCSPLIEDARSTVSSAYIRWLTIWSLTNLFRQTCNWELAAHVLAI